MRWRFALEIPPDVSEIANLMKTGSTLKISRPSNGLWASALRRVARGAVAGSIGTTVIAGLAWGQAAPRYQSPFGTPATQPQALPATPAITPNGVVVEDVIARVNDQIINRSDVQRSQQQLQQELQQNNLPPSEREQREKDMLRDMIDQQLLISKGKELGLNADAEVVRRLDEIRKQNHLETMEDLEKAARQQGVSFEDFKAGIKNNVITQQVVRDEVGRRLQMTQGQEQAFYDAHKQEFAQPEQVRLSEILVPLPADADAAAVAQAQAKADDIAAKLKSGGKFDDLAKQYSGGPTATQGGDLGAFKRGALAKVLEDQTFDLKAGDSTAPIRTKQGFVILKVTEHQQPGVPAMKDVEPQIQEAMYLQQMQPALRAYLTRLREEAYIEIKPGFVDSGASSKQTRPVFSAYAPPAPKKKALQKARFERGTRPASATAGSLATSPGTSAAAPVTRTSGGVPTLPAEGADPVPSSAASGASTSAGPEAPLASTPGTAATATDTSGSGKTRASGRSVASVRKEKKIRREKVRFGQAPRNSLPAGSLETASGADVGEGATSAAITPGGQVAGGSAPDGPQNTASNAAPNPAPGSAMAPISATSSTSDPDPLAPKTVSTEKTRFSAKEKQVRAEKVASKQAKVREKIAATPAGPERQETATQKTQAAPLGLNGDTATKKKHVKVKGEAKERLQDKRPDATPDKPIAPTVNPSALGAGGVGATEPASPTADTTTLPPVTAPAPGAPPAGQPLSPTGTPATPNGTPAPQPK